MSKILDKMLEQLTCPICLVHPENEVYQCENGHPVCSSCHLRLKKCPQCKKPFIGFPRIRLRLMESLLDIASLPCGNKDFGCTQLLLRKDLPNHQKNCEFRSVSLCKWMGFECNFAAAKVEPLINHLVSSHNAVKWNNIMWKNFSQEGQLRSLILHECTVEPGSLEKAWILLVPRLVVGPNQQRFFSCVPILLQDEVSTSEHEVHLEVIIRQDSKKRILSKWTGYPLNYKDAEEEVLNPSFRLSTNYIKNQSRKFGNTAGFNLAMNFSVTTINHIPSNQPDVNPTFSQ